MDVIKPEPVVTKLEITEEERHKQENAEKQVN